MKSAARIVSVILLFALALWSVASVKAGAGGSSTRTPGVLGSSALGVGIVPVADTIDDHCVAPPSFQSYSL